MTFAESMPTAGFWYRGGLAVVVLISSLSLLPGAL